MDLNVSMRNYDKVQVDENGSKYVKVEEFNDDESSNNCLSRIIMNNYDLDSANIDLYDKNYEEIEKQVMEANKGIYGNSDENADNEERKNTILLDDEKLILPELKKEEKPPVDTPPAQERAENVPPTEEAPVDTPPAQSTSEEKEFDYSQDDGVISATDKAKNFVKGLASPVTSMFESPENFAKGAGMIAGGAALIYATGGLAAPLLVGGGLAYGAFKVGEGAVDAYRAKTDKAAEEAWQGMGEGTFFGAGSLIGAKPAARKVGVNTEEISSLAAAGECIKEIPNSLKGSFSALKDKATAGIESLKNKILPSETAELASSSEINVPKPKESAPVQQEEPKAIESAQLDEQPVVPEETPIQTGNNNIRTYKDSHGRDVTVETLENGNQIKKYTGLGNRQYTDYISADGKIYVQEMVDKFGVKVLNQFDENGTLINIETIGADGKTLSTEFLREGKWYKLQTCEDGIKQMVRENGKWVEINQEPATPIESETQAEPAPKVETEPKPAENPVISNDFRTETYMDSRNRTCTKVFDSNNKLVSKEYYTFSGNRAFESYENGEIISRDITTPNSKEITLFDKNGGYRKIETFNDGTQEVRVVDKNGKTTYKKMDKDGNILDQY